MKLMFDLVQDELRKNSKITIAMNEVSVEILSRLAGDKTQKFLLDNIEKPEKIVYKDIPSMAPPYEDMWFEWTDTTSTFFRTGVHFHTKKENEGWALWLSFYLEPRKADLAARNLGSVILLPYLVNFSLPPSGRVTSALNFRYYTLASLPRAEMQADLKQIHAAVATFVATALFSIGLLHCKNIVAVEKGGKNPNVKNRRHRSKGTKHYILNVIPARNIKRTEYEQPAKGSSQRIHFRRGHFKEYTSERPLFGKYVGAFWWEAHAAGNADIGEVKKDYRILPMQQ